LAGATWAVSERHFTQEESKESEESSVKSLSLSARVLCARDCTYATTITVITGLGGGYLHKAADREEIIDTQTRKKKKKKVETREMERHFECLWSGHTSTVHYACLILMRAL